MTSELFWALDGFTLLPVKEDQGIVGKMDEQEVFSLFHLNSIKFVFLGFPPYPAKVRKQSPLRSK